jgi:transposase InsO family protein
MGHLNIEHPERLYTDGQIVPNKPANFHCPTCHTSKSVHRRPVADPAEKRQTKTLEVIHSDLSGRFSRKSLGGAGYYITFIDDATRYTWVKFLKLKSDAAQAIMDFVTYAATQFDTSVKRFKSDNGGEYMASAVQGFFRRKGIVHDTIPPYLHELNGVPERFNRSVTQMARSMITSDDLLPLWAEAVHTATFLKNIAPHASDTLHRTPHERLFGKKPAIKHLHPFGITAYVHIPVEARKAATKLLHQAETGIFVGYGRNTKTARVYIPDRHVVLETRNVTFGPFKTTLYFQGSLEPADDDITGDNDDPRPYRVSTNRRNKIDPTDLGDPLTLEALNPDMLPPPTPRHGTRRTGATYPPLATGSAEPRQPSAGPSSSGRPPSPPRNNRVGGLSQQPSSTTTSREGSTVSETMTRSGRVVRPSQKAKDAANQQGHAATMLINLPPLQDHSAEFSTYTAAVDIDDEIPQSYEEARDNPLWNPTLLKEINAHEENGTWELVDVKDLPSNVKFIGTRWVFAAKRDESGKIVKRKARIVAQGFSQRPGLDFDETYSPVIRYDSLRIILMIALIHAWTLQQIDFDTAYLNANLKHVLYGRCPPGLPNARGKHLRFLRSLYGLKQSGREWHEVLTDWLISIGFTQARFDPCTFMSEHLILGIYVDDVLMAGTPEATSAFLDKAGGRFKIKDLGQPRLLLGLEIDYTDNGIRLHQRAYAQSILRQYGMENCNGRRTPLDPNHFPPRSTDPVDPVRTRLYQSIVGSLNFLAIVSRPDLSYVTSFLGTYNSNPSEVHLKLAYQVLRFVRQTYDHEITMTVPPTQSLPAVSITMYSDASFASDPDNAKSFSGYILKVFGSTVSWSSKRQSCVAQSTCEAEYMAASHAASHLVWTRQAFTELLPSANLNCLLLVDNEPALSLIRDHRLNQRSKHINVHYHFVRERYLDDEYDIQHVSSANNLADIGTKALPRPTLKLLTDRIFGNDQ